jgi:hypothetical protein
MLGLRQGSPVGWIFSTSGFHRFFATAFCWYLISERGFGLVLRSARTRCFREHHFLLIALDCVAPWMLTM